MSYPLNGSVNGSIYTHQKHEVTIGSEGTLQKYYFSKYVFTIKKTLQISFEEYVFLFLSEATLVYVHCQILLHSELDSVSLCNSQYW